MQIHSDPQTPVEEWPFDRWVRAVIVDKVQEVMRIYRNIRPMEEWLFVDGVQRVDYIARFESLEREWKEEICPRLGIAPVKLPHANKSDHPFYLEIYREHPELVDIVGDFYRRDIERFGYTLEG